MPRVIDWASYEALKAEGVGDRDITRRWGIPCVFHGKAATDSR
jgi:hypothetical protein